MIKLPNSPEYIAAFYGVLLADCVAVPLPMALEPARQQTIEAVCRPVIVIAQPDARMAANADNRGILLPLAASAETKPQDSENVRRAGDDLAMLLFTSGSTGVPKGVMLSHRNLLANAISILRDLPIRATDRTLTLLPFCHAFGNSILQTHVLAGATMVMAGNLMFPATVVDALTDFEATSFSAIPEVYGMLLKYGGIGERPMPKLRYMSVAGGALRPDLAQKVAAAISPAAFYVMYGQSEATARLSVLPPDQFSQRPGSIGKALSGVDLAVMDSDGLPVEGEGAGLLHARGENVMQGYWDDPAGTADVLRADGWLKTGDMAHRDGDGYYYLDGRANLLVKVQGYRVHPAEIENVVEARFPNTRAVALPMVRGEETRFALFLAAQDDHVIDVADVRAACARELPAYKVPLYVEVLDQFPLTSAYKVDRAALSLLIPDT